MAIDEARARVQKIIAEAAGRWGVAVRDLQTGEGFGFDADELYPLASTFKVPVLVELFRQADQGIVDLDERLSFEPADRMPGSGVLREMAPGFALTVRDYAMLMIIVSDNSATDKVMHHIGRQSVTPAMESLGLTQTFVSRTCGQILCSLGGMEVERPTPDQVEEVLGALRAGRRSDDTWAYEESARNNAGTPEDMVQLLELIYRGEAASPEGCRGMIDILSRQQLKQRIPLYLPPDVVTASKTGTLPGVVNDTGLIYLNPERACALAVFSKNGADRIKGSLTAAEIGLAVYEELT